MFWRGIFDLKFSFIHSADWQLGKLFGAFDDETAGRLRAARISVIERIAAAAHARNIQHILVAGDIFDRENAEASVYSQPIAKLRAYKDLIWHLIPGNHDTVRGRIWGPLVEQGLGDNIRLYLEPGCHQISDGVRLLVAPVMTKTATDDLTAWMDDATTPADDIRIGLAHGSVMDFGSEASILIDGSRAQKAGLDYLALGDWHGFKEINARTYYSGTPEPDSFKQNDPGAVLSVTLDGHGGAPEVEQVKVGQYVWHERTLEISGDFEMSRVTEGLDVLSPQPDHLLLKFRLEGMISPEAYARLDQVLLRLAATYGAVTRNEKRLKTRLLASDLESMKSDPTLHLTATRLQEMAEAGADGDKYASETALKRLYIYAAHLSDGEAS